MIIREISIDDAQEAAELSAELGYPVSAQAMRIRIETLHGLPEHAVYVACKADAVVGWIDVGIVHHLQAEPYGEIGGLVVSDKLRSGGIGRQLVAVAEQWARDRGVSNMLVRSRISREAAHRFYEREGYARTKTSAVFTKELL
jgi:GNAT superfamily N-acetyltransferase